MTDVGETHMRNSHQKNSCEKLAST